MTEAQLAGPAMLFCPADRSDRYQKALGAAESVILDLEDGVAPQAREAARAALRTNPLDPDRVVVRINAYGHPEHEDDLAAVRRTPYRRVMLAKAETPAQLAALEALQVIALCETPLGILNAAAIAAQPNVIALMWGAEDLVAAMGGSTSRASDGQYRDVARHARSAVLLAARAHSRWAIDAVNTDIANLAVVTAEAEDAAASGFTHKACIHPTHAAAIRAAYRPTEAQVTRARRIVELADGRGVLSIDGEMIDAPLLGQARAILARLGSPGSG